MLRTHTIKISKYNLFVLFLLLLFISWFIPFFSMLWQSFDNHFALLSNTLVSYYPPVHSTIAFLNSRLGDWIYEIVVACFYLIRIVLTKNREEKKKRFYLFLILALIIVFVQICINTLIFSKLVSIDRKSPSYLLNLPANFSSFTFPHNRIYSLHSFPSDRATSLFLCILFSCKYLDRLSSSLILYFSLPFFLTRLIVGAHWLTDILFGGFFISFIFLFFLFKILDNKSFVTKKIL